MPHRNWTIGIHDILESIEAIQKYTEGLQFESFKADRKTVDAVVRNFIVIGEAATHLPEDVCRDHPEIPWYEMRGIRNIVVHEYFSVSDKVIWQTVQKDLPPLIPLLKRMLD